MTSTIMVYNFPAFVVADDEAGLATGDAYECQLTVATLDPTVTFATIPANGCQGAIQSPSAASWTLNVTWLQDWSAAGGGLSGWAWTNRLLQKWFKLVPDKNDVTVAASGQFFVAPGTFGGTFGDGSAGIATAAWNLIGDPILTLPALL